MDVYEELSFCENSKKKNFFRGGGSGGGSGSGWGWGRGLGRGGVDLGVRVDVNEELKFL